MERSRSEVVVFRRHCSVFLIIPLLFSNLMRISHCALVSLLAHLRTLTADPLSNL
jgi:hypothetical protein